MSPGARSGDVVRRHLMALRLAVAQLRSLHVTSAHALNDLATRWQVERGLQLATQNAIDIATHLAAEAGHDVADYTTAIDKLGELGILPAAFARQFRAIGGLRNVLVHGYLEPTVKTSGRLQPSRSGRLGTYVRGSLGP